MLALTYLTARSKSNLALGLSADVRVASLGETLTLSDVAPEDADGVGRTK